MCIWIFPEFLGLLLLGWPPCYHSAQLPMSISSNNPLSNSSYSSLSVEIMSHPFRWFSLLLSVVFSSTFLSIYVVLLLLNPELRRVSFLFLTWNLWMVGSTMLFLVRVGTAVYHSARITVNLWLFVLYNSFSRTCSAILCAHNLYYRQDDREVLLVELEEATSYKTWLDISTRLDRLEGNNDWKQKAESDLYDWQALLAYTVALRKARRNGRMRRLMFLLRTCSHRNFCNLNNPELFDHARVGTKAAIHDFIAEVCRGLDYLCTDIENAINRQVGHTTSSTKLVVVPSNDDPNYSTLRPMNSVTKNMLRTTTYDGLLSSPYNPLQLERMQTAPHLTTRNSKEYSFFSSSSAMSCWNHSALDTTSDSGSSLLAPESSSSTLGMNHSSSTAVIPQVGSFSHPGGVLKKFSSAPLMSSSSSSSSPLPIRQRRTQSFNYRRYRNVDIPRRSASWTSFQPSGGTTVTLPFNTPSTSSYHLSTSRRFTVSRGVQTDDDFLYATSPPSAHNSVQFTLPIGSSIPPNTESADTTRCPTTSSAWSGSTTGAVDKRRGRVFGRLQEFRHFFANVRLAVGRTALCLSGGGALAMYHLGVVKALAQLKMLPRVVSGTSGGSIVAGVIAISTDQDILESVTLPDISSRYGKRWFPPVMQQIKRFITSGQMMDPDQFKSTCLAYYGSWTFAEAFEKTGRLVSLVVSPAGKSRGAEPLILNCVNTPDVLIWSAVAASCALPGLMLPTELYAKNCKGQAVPNYPQGLKWMDGSIKQDIPHHELSSLFNVKQFVVSQVNPHAAPFVKSSTASGRSARSIENWLTLDIKNRYAVLAQFNMIPKIFGQNISTFWMSQDHEGHVTITPRASLFDWYRIINHPSTEDMKYFINSGQCMTFPHISRIGHTLRIEQALRDCWNRIEKCVTKLKAKEYPTVSRLPSAAVTSAIHSIKPAYTPTHLLHMVSPDPANASRIDDDPRTEQSETWMDFGRCGEDHEDEEEDEDDLRKAVSSKEKTPLHRFAHQQLGDEQMQIAPLARRERRLVSDVGFALHGYHKELS